MKLYITMKTPDAIDTLCAEYTETLKGDILEYQRGLSVDDVENIQDKVVELKKMLAKWFTYGECINLCVDTDAKTLTIVGA